MNERFPKCAFESPEALCEIAQNESVACPLKTTWKCLEPTIKIQQDKDAKKRLNK